MINDMTEIEVRDLLNDIASEFGIGDKVRTPSVMLTCIQNSIRRADCLSRIENYLTKTEAEDGEEFEVCPLNWGDEPDRYLERFKAVFTA